MDEVLRSRAIAGEQEREAEPTGRIAKVELLEALGRGPLALVDHGRPAFLHVSKNTLGVRSAARPAQRIRPPACCEGEGDGPGEKEELMGRRHGSIVFDLVLATALALGSLTAPPAAAVASSV